MNAKRKVAIIGHFGGSEKFFDGQTIKTKILYDELVLYTDWKIKKVDTYYKNKQPLKLLYDTFVALLTTKDIIVLLSGNGMKFYFPLLYVAAKLKHTHVYHDVIGGNLDFYVEKIPGFRCYLNSFKVNWVETQGLKNKLENVGIYNSQVIPNFKNLKIISESELKYGFSEPYNFCTFSRVMDEKGIGDAIEAIEKINKKTNCVKCTLDIYGVIDPSYKEEFQRILENSSDAIKYVGCIDYDKSSETLKEYFALLFPTRWSGEGFPGTIIDSFCAGLPVIATDWNCNAEIIKNGSNGILYVPERKDSLQCAIEQFIEHNNADDIKRYRINCRRDAYKYQPESCLPSIISMIVGE